MVFKRDHSQYFGFPGKGSPVWQIFKVLVTMMYQKVALLALREDQKSRFLEARLRLQAWQKPFWYIQRVRKSFFRLCLRSRGLQKF